MKFQITKKIILFAGIFSALPLSAQQIVPWVAKSLSKDAITARISSAAKSAALNGTMQATLLHVNPQVLINDSFVPYDFTTAPATLSTADKALWAKPKAAAAQLGLASVLYDQNAILYTALKQQGSKDILETEFKAHQQSIENAVEEMEKVLTSNSSFLLYSQLPRNFHGWEKVFAKVDSGIDKFTLQRLFDGDPQPLFPAMTKGEMETFAGLPSLATQRAYIEDSIAVCKEQMQRIVSQDVESLSEDALTTYYLQKVRLNYFEQVQQRLEQATEKQTSLIIREPVVLQEGLPAMTDAQRLGYVQMQIAQLEKRLAQTSASRDVLRENLNQVVTMKDELASLNRSLLRLQELYGPYARAEVFGFPYEKSFHIGPTSFLLLPEKESSYLLSLEGAALKQEIQKRLAAVEHDIAQKQLEIPLDVSFYADYYRLMALKEIYNKQMLFAF